MDIVIKEARENTAYYRALLSTAEALNQTKYIAFKKPHHLESILLGAFANQQCVGFLRMIIQIIGNQEGCTPITDKNNTPLKEGYAEAFGVLPSFRRQGIGQQLQEKAIALCRKRNCYQMRSKSPITSQENYALKLKMGYSIHPDTQHDAYYFILTL